MQHFSTTQRITTGGRLGHDRIGLLCYVHIIKKTMNIGIYIYIPSTDLHYRLVEFYSLSTINSFLNTENGSFFFNTLINNVHGLYLNYILPINMP